MTKKSKSLLIGSTFVGALLVGAIAVTSVYVYRKNNDYHSQVVNLTPGAKTPTNQVPAEPLPNEKVESIVVKPASVVINLKDLKADAFSFVTIEINNTQVTAPVSNDGKAVLNVEKLKSNSRYPYRVIGVKADSSTVAIYTSELRTSVGPYFDLGASTIRQNDAILHIAGMELYAGQIRPQFSIKYKIKDTSSDSDTLLEKNVDKQMMLSENVYTINLDNLSAGRTYIFIFGSQGEEVLSGEFTTQALQNTGA